MGLLNKNTVVATTLVDMYVKCGVLEKPNKCWKNFTFVMWSLGMY